jgi:hypothetical protein
MSTVTSSAHVGSSPRSLPSARSPTEFESSPRHVAWAERFAAAFPLFFVGVACLVVSYEMYVAGTVSVFDGNSSVHLQPWLLFLALGITGVSAGIVTLFVEEEPAGPSGLEAAVATSPTQPVWDESSIEGKSTGLARRRTWEARWNSLDAEPSEGSATDAVLDQLDEIERSLRKKPPTPSG